MHKIAKILRSEHFTIGLVRIKLPGINKDKSPPPGLKNMILKKVIDRFKGSSGNIELSNDTLITLSQIESGCLFIPYEERALMILKGEESETEDLSGLSSISISSELIERPEFPTIAAYIKVHAKNNREFDYEYYFNIEASEEMELLEKISKDKNIEVVIYDEPDMLIKLVKLDDNDRAAMASMLERARHLFDKA